MSVTSRVTVRVLVSAGGSHELPTSGTATLTVTWFVDSSIVLGVIVVVAPFNPVRFKKSLALVVASLALAPGTMTLRAAS